MLEVPLFWQRPAITEKTAWTTIKKESGLAFQYFAVPWATVFDGIEAQNFKAFMILDELKRQLANCHGSAIRRATVSQHIHTLSYIPLFKVCGITDLFWPHKTDQLSQVDGITLHSFPLFPVQAKPVEINKSFFANKTYEFNFIGAYRQNLYLSDIRKQIFKLSDVLPNSLIVDRGAWFFEETVYGNQLGKFTSTSENTINKNKQAEEYTSAIETSWFSFCPSGSGPNSIRLLEVLSLGSIPIVFSNDLDLSFLGDDWKTSVLHFPETEEGLQQAVRHCSEMGLRQRQQMVKNGQKLFKRIHPKNFGTMIRRKLQG